MYIYLPNFLTFVRLFSLLLIFKLFYYKKILLSICITVFAIFTDFLDGYAARRFKCQSSFGEIFDPAADKLFILALSLYLYYYGFFNSLLLHFVFIRYVVQITSFIFVKLFAIDFYIKPSLFAKCATSLLYIIILNSLISSTELVAEFDLFFKIHNIFIVLAVFSELLLMVYYPFQFFFILSKKKKGFD